MADPTADRPTAPTEPDPDAARGAVSGEVLEPAAAADEAGADADGANLARRRFFRQFAGEIFQTAATVVGTAQALQRASAEAAGAILDPVGTAARIETPTPAPPVPRAEPGAPGLHGGAAPTGFRTPFREDGHLYLIDQRKLPDELVEVEVRNAPEAATAIREMVVRGAPAIGVAAAFGVYLGVKDFPIPRKQSEVDLKGFDRRFNEICKYLATSRPTAVNLFWAIDRMKGVFYAPKNKLLRATPSQLVRNLKKALLDEAKEMLKEDTAVCKAIGKHGMKLVKEICGRKKEYGVLTHCNAGSLCAVTYGTALAPIYYGAEHGEKFHVFADETRPLLQGARITAFELQASGIPVTVICDNMAATVMSQGKVNAIIVGTDRVAANGDVANKIGTLGVAILARHYGIPFFVAAPTSSIDPAIATGKQIPIEERDPREISHGLGRQTVADGTAIYNPAFDVTPAELVTALITEKGVLRPPYGQAIRKVLA